VVICSGHFKFKRPYILLNILEVLLCCRIDHILNVIGLKSDSNSVESLDTVPDLDPWGGGGGGGGKTGISLYKYEKIKIGQFSC
jgi:hypothetical protein